MNRQGLSHIAPAPGESHFPQSHGPPSTSDRFVSVLASHFSDHSSHASQMPPPGWPPGILQVKAPEVNPAASSQTAPLPPFPFSWKAHHLPNGQSQKPEHHPFGGPPPHLQPNWSPRPGSCVCNLLQIHLPFTSSQGTVPAFSPVALH